MSLYQIVAVMCVSFPLYIIAYPVCEKRETASFAEPLSCRSILAILAILEILTLALICRSVFTRVRCEILQFVAVFVATLSKSLFGSPFCLLDVFRISTRRCDRLSIRQSIGRSTTHELNF